jgi:hypothetical protein
LYSAVIVYACKWATKIVIIKSTDNKYEESIYTFEHNKKLITKRKYRKHTIDSGGYFGLDSRVEESTTQESIKYYTQDDILSLFFNLSKKFDVLKSNQTFYAVGGDKKDGSVDVHSPTDNRLKSINQDLNVIDGKTLIVIINQKIFSSKKGELFVNIDSDSVCKSALLKDVLLFGADIEATLIAKSKGDI